MQQDSLSRENGKKAARAKTRSFRRLYRGLLGVLLLGLLLWRLDPGNVAATLSRPRWSWVLVALVVQAAIKLLWGIRWRAILASVGLEGRLFELVALVFVGHYLNYFLPTSAGGDLVRGYYAVAPGASKLDSYAVVLAERFLGLLSLLFIVVLASGFGLLRGDSLPPAFLLTLLSISLLGLVLGLMPLAGYRFKFEPRTLPTRFASRVFAALALFRRAESQRWLIASSSLALQALGLVFQLACARAMGVATDTVTLLLIAAAALVASMIPITLNGLGVREGTLVGLLIASGESAAPAGAFALLARLIAAAFAGLGGLALPFVTRAESDTS